MNTVNILNVYKSTHLYYVTDAINEITKKI